jgi:DNA ligase 4
MKLAPYVAYPQINSFHSNNNKIPDSTASPLSIAEVDKLLDELAATCAFSGATIRNRNDSACQRSKFHILCSLFRSMTPLDASFLTQIILKDLCPLLYPASYRHYTAALTEFNSNSVIMLSKEDAMTAWDPSGWMLEMYRVRASLDEASNEFENSPRDSLIIPRVGIPIEVENDLFVLLLTNSHSTINQIPKSSKGQGCAHALSSYSNSSKVWAETKYDGERAQIHVEVSDDGSSRITIFSKSKRDSTEDRYAIHRFVPEA